MRPPFVVLDFPASAARPGGRSRLFANPVRVLEASSMGAVEPLLRDVDREVAQGRHAVGFVSYEAAPACDPALVAHPPGAVPLAWFGIFGAPREWGNDAAVGAPTARWRERTDAHSHARAVERIRAMIDRGDVYQVNYTVRLDIAVSDDTASLYRRLLAAQGAGYGAHIHTGRHEILSASPELFFERCGDRIVTKPMKGTARRGRWLTEDDERVAGLATSEKERAENVMIVDLVRNDLGRISRVGSVRVTSLFEVERRPTVLQMTSSVEASLRDGISTRDIFAALFPCGSVTGAPKIAASQAIAALEDDPRGVYCGAIGHIAPNGDSTFSVAIRTVTIDHATGHAEYGVGSGVTWDSDSAAEYDEVKAKASILTADLPTFALIETLRLTAGRYSRLERHLARVEASAEYFGFHPARAVRTALGRALEDHAAAAGPAECHRVRVRITPDAVCSVDWAPLSSTSASPQRVAVALSPVRRGDRFLFHKTTHRTVYETHRAEHPDAFDVLLWNEGGEITEFTIGNVVVEFDGLRWTPARECGLLGGTFREELLERNVIRERVIRRDELASATRIWLINSVREWVPVELD